MGSVKSEYLCKKVYQANRGTERFLAQSAHEMAVCERLERKLERK